MALTTEQIHAIADQLYKQDIKPTLAEVREALGGGSFTTISEAMKSWREDNKNEQKLKQVDLPNAINDRLQALGADMWQNAIDIANDRLAKERDALELIKAKAQNDVDQLEASVKTLEAEYNDLMLKLDELASGAEVSAVKAEQAIAARDEINELLNDARHQLELERTKANTAQEQLAEIRIALDKKQLELDKKQSELNASSSEVTRLQVTSENKKAEIERLSTELKITKEDLKAVTTERDDIKTTTAELRGELKAIIAERDKLMIANEALLTSNEKLTRSHAQLETENKALDKSYTDLVANNVLQQERTEALKSEFEQLQAELTKAQATVNN